MYIHAVILLLAVGSLYNIVTDHETWPFSQYPMYSEPRGNGLAYLQLFGITQEEPHREVPLNDPSYVEPVSRYLRPFDRSRMRFALGWILVGKEGEQRRQMLDEALLDSLRRYETLRLAGHHDGPPLRGLKLYQLRWRLDPWARNVDLPDDRVLVAEVEQP